MEIPDGKTDERTVGMNVYLSDLVVTRPIVTVHLRRKGKQQSDTRHIVFSVLGAVYVGHGPQVSAHLTFHEPTRAGPIKWARLQNTTTRFPA
jgi:hypothetical protein